MRYTWVEQNERGISLTLVQFAGEGRERRWGRRMNRFYEALEAAAKTYAVQCITKDPHARYVCRMDAVVENDRVLVTVTLSLRQPGVVSRKKELCHVWQKGVLRCW